ncbi:MAG TPA: tRNA (adenosine(37)-N6)-threonylcarbamoyltransferase complex ATPase subunit type 1 TsaE [Rhodobacteraceae bacterium]|nr:tRNA (adenosine(37)-N6)-threonylcarbamoyltransferase complex ATPase subunit type 1 TsaE [Paracoccaceae bacterium]
MSAPFRHFTFGSPDETAAFARALAPGLRAGDVLLLEGQIGSGKTHFARALIQARLVADGAPAEDVPSPTFTLVQTYDTGRVEIWHADLYRLTHVDEVEELGLAEAFTEAVCLIEWPDRLGDLAPDGALSLSFATGAGPDTRVVSARSNAPAWAERLGVLFDDI